MEELFFLTLTILVELPVALTLLRKEDWRRVCFAVIGVNMISHPIIWFFLFHYGVNWFVAETSVAIFEGAILAALFPKRRWPALFTGIFMNVITAAIGYWGF